MMRRHLRVGLEPQPEGGEVVIRPERVQSLDVVEIELGSPPIEAEE